MKVFACSAAVLLATAVAQQAGTLTAETHPPLSSQTCTAPGSCTTESTKIVLDANWRWLHNVGGSTNCYTGNKWDATYCPDSKTCASNCALDGADYQGTYGIQASGDSVSIKLVTHGPYSTNIGSRIYLMADDSKYKMFKLLNKEFAFDVDMSKIPCGLNGALYFVNMDEDGGLSRYPTNKAGAKYGTGYCDAQCAREIKFINGEANNVGWVPSTDDPNAGVGPYGTCCTEMDIWEANTAANAYTTHPCTVLKQTRCTGDKECGTGSGNRYNGLCDMDGCDLNPFRMGDQTFFGPGSEYKVDTTKPITVVTQFITADGTDNGTLKEIRRVYKQNGKVIQNTKIATKGVDAVNSISDATCGQMKKAFGDTDDHAKKGGFKQMGESMKNGMVLVMSLWDDHAAHCLWLDSKYPADKDDSVPGVLRGKCPTTSGVPKEVEAQYPDATVKFGNIKFGAIGSTTEGVGKDSSSDSGATSAPAPSSSAGSSAGPTTPAPTATTPAPSATTAAPAPGSGSGPAGESSGSSGSEPGPGTVAPAPGSGSAETPAPTVTQTPVPSTGSPATTAPTPTPSNGGGEGAARWMQCGGNNWTGPTTCKEGTCQHWNEWYYQCV